jgi:hypothetical protein
LQLYHRQQENKQAIPSEHIATIYIIALVSAIVKCYNAFVVSTKGGIGKDSDTLFQYSSRGLSAFCPVNTTEIESKSNFRSMVNFPENEVQYGFKATLSGYP